MIKGAVSFVAGLRLLLATAELRAILWRMIGLLLLLMLLLTGGVFWLVDYIAHMWIPEGDAWYWQVLSWLVWMLALLLALVCGAVSFVTLGSAAVAPWLDELAARTEIMHGGVITEQSGGIVQMMLQSLSHSIRPLLGLMIWGVAALLCFWLPPLATALWTIGGIRFLSYELIDTPASRRDWDFQARKSKLREQRWFYFGFSGVAMALLLVPVLNLLVIPAAVVGLSINMLDARRMEQ